MTLLWDVSSRSLGEQCSNLREKKQRSKARRVVTISANTTRPDIAAKVPRKAPIRSQLEAFPRAKNGTEWTHLTFSFFARPAFGFTAKTSQAETSILA